MMTVPDNQIWGSVITNSSGATTRRVDLLVDVAADLDAAHIQAKLEDSWKVYWDITRAASEVVNRQRAVRS
jgi:hypothetical protein